MPLIEGSQLEWSLGRAKLPCDKEGFAPPWDIGDNRHISLTHVLSKTFGKIVAEKLSHFRRLPAFLFSVFVLGGLGTCNVLLTLSGHLQAALDRRVEKRLIKLDCSAIFDRVNQYGLLYKMRSIVVWRQYLSMESEFVSDRRQRVWLDSKVSALVDVNSGGLRAAF